MQLKSRIELEYERFQSWHSRYVLGVNGRQHKLGLSMQMQVILEIISHNRIAGRQMHGCAEFHLTTRALKSPC